MKTQKVKAFFKVISITCVTLSFAPLLISCAPERGEFTSSTSLSKHLQEKQQSSSASLNLATYSDNQFEIQISKDQEKIIQDFTLQMEENKIAPKAGMFQTYFEKNPLTGVKTKFKSIFNLKDENNLVLQTINIDAGKVIKETADFDKQDFIQEMIFLISDLKNVDNRSKIYQNVKKFLALFCRDKIKTTEDFRITVRIDRAKSQISKDGVLIFKLVAVAFPTDYKDIEPLAFEIRFRTDVPKSFQCTYKAWGKTKANQILFSSESYGIEEASARENLEQKQESSPKLEEESQKEDDEKKEEPTIVESLSPLFNLFIN